MIKCNTVNFFLTGTGDIRSFFTGKKKRKERPSEAQREDPLSKKATNAVIQFQANVIGKEVCYLSFFLIRWDERVKAKMLFFKDFDYFNGIKICGDLISRMRGFLIFRGDLISQIRSFQISIGALFCRCPYEILSN